MRAPKTSAGERRDGERDELFDQAVDDHHSDRPRFGQPAAATAHDRLQPGVAPRRSDVRSRHRRRVQRQPGPRSDHVTKEEWQAIKQQRDSAEADEQAEFQYE
jgi:hypothetical protein